KQLSSLYYQDKTLYLQEYQNRFNSTCNYKFPISVAGNQAFTVITPEMVLIMEEIYEYSNQINKLFLSIPSVAKNDFLNECLVEEIINTNGIEGVHSTRKEIQFILSDSPQNDKLNKKIKRFEGIAKKYSALLNDNEEVCLSNCQDFIDLYNILVKPEIEKDDYPDGKYFRKDSVSVLSETQKPLHQGLYPEEKIIEEIGNLIKIIEDKNLPKLIKTAVVQYFIGYIHPFYDGNGRFGRFVGSYLLSKSLEKLTAIRLSFAIKNNLSKYYKAFENCNNSKNKGEITSFVYFILKTILVAEKDILQNLTDRSEQLTFYSDKLDKIKIACKNQVLCKQILFILIQNALFSTEELDMNTLMKVLDKSKNTIKNCLEFLIHNNFPIICSKAGRKKLYKLNLEIF
ncbi:MAG: Fic family protein, partial [Oscillospiraceae bacterium]